MGLPCITIQLYWLFCLPSRSVKTLPSKNRSMP